MKKIITILIALVGMTVSAQIKMGNNPTTINSSAVLELESTTKGFLPPRMTQVQMNNIASPATGLMVYCLDCNPAGIFNYNGTSWSVLGSSTNPVAVFSTGTVNCGALNGSYSKGVVMGASNYKTVTLTNTGAGTITASTNTANGVSFSVTTTVYSTGSQTLALAASGMPQDGGTYNYTVTINGSTTCSFNVTFMDFISARASVSATADGSSGPYTAGYLNLTALSSNNMSVSSGNTVTLHANKTYRLTAFVKQITNNAILSYAFVDASTAGTTPLTGTTYGGALGTVGVNPVPATGFYTVGSSDVNVKLKLFTIVGGPNGHNNTEGANSVVIEEVPSGSGFLVTKPSVNQTPTTNFNLNVGTTIANSTPAIDAPVVNGTGSTGITLRKGKLYRLRADLRVVNAWFNYYFSDASGTIISGTTVGSAFAATNTSGGTQGPTPATGVHLVSNAADETIYLHVSVNVGGSLLDSDFNGENSIIIEEIPTSAQYLSATIPDTHGIGGGNIPMTSVSNSGITITGAGTTGAYFTLAANKTYELISDIRNGGASYFGNSFVNSANDVVPAGIIAGGAMAPARQNPVPSTGIITTGSGGMQVQLRIYSGGTGDIPKDDNGHSSILVRELK